MKNTQIALVTLLFASSAAADVSVKRVRQDVAKPDPQASYWEGVPAQAVMLFGQPMVIPRPVTTETASISVQAITDGAFVAFRLKWADPEKSEAGRLGLYSDAVALEFPVKLEPLPPVMMGAPTMPVHLFHWRAQYQRDAEKGKPTTKDLYPNTSIDSYPMEFVSAAGGTAEQREQFSPGAALGNPQSYAKNGVDEIIAEGFGTSAVQDGHSSAAVGSWKNGEWTVVIARRLAVEGGSVLKPGQNGFVGFAVWQGGKDEVGSRKSVTMAWTPVTWSE